MIDKKSLAERFAFQVRAVKLPAPEREYNFTPLVPAKKKGKYKHLRRWCFDFAWLTEHVVVEIEGGTWTGGGHVRGKVFRDNCDKYNSALLLGWRVLRFDTDMVRDGTGLRYLEMALGVRGVGELF